MKDLLYIPFRFENGGTQVIHYLPEDYVPIKTITQLLKDNKKSVNIKTIENEGYRIINIPSNKKRVYLDSDYSVLLNLEEFD